MAKHTIAMTAVFKEAKVRAGEIRQTIRPVGKRRYAAGDELLIHGWAGVPYRSPWSWRLRARVTEVITISMNNDGITCPMFPVLLAEADGFNSLADMKDWFCGRYDLSTTKYFWVIRWDVIE